MPTAGTHCNITYIRLAVLYRHLQSNAVRVSGNPSKRKSSRAKRQQLAREESMNFQRRYVVFVLLAAAAMPAFGQAVAPTIGPANSGKGSAASVPDLSGIWVHSIPGFEPLPSGP